GTCGLRRAAQRMPALTPTTGDAASPTQPMSLTKWSLLVKLRPVRAVVRGVLAAGKFYGLVVSVLQPFRDGFADVVGLYQVTRRRRQVLDTRNIVAQTYDRMRELLRRIRDEQVFAIPDFQPFRADGCRNHRPAGGERLQYLQPCAAARPQRH